MKPLLQTCGILLVGYAGYRVVTNLLPKILLLTGEGLFILFLLLAGIMLIVYNDRRRRYGSTVPWAVKALGTA